MPGAVYPFRGRIFRESNKFRKLKDAPIVEFLCGKCLGKTQTNFIEISYPRVECKFCKTKNVMPYYIPRDEDDVIIIDNDKDFVMEC